VPHVFSPSQIHVWNLCNRKWAWHHVAGLPRPPQADSAKLGQRVDELMRAHYTSAQNVAPHQGLEGEILVSALAHLPKHGAPFVRVGDYRTVKTRHTWRCQTDLEDVGVTYDLKTTGDLRYALKPDQLARDPQAVIYAQARRALQVTWVYAVTKGPTRKTLPVTYTFTPEELAARVAEIDATADDMQKLLDASTKDVLAVPPNFEGCSAYGGCPYQENCGRTTKASNYTMNDIMSMFQIPGAPAPAASPIAPPVQDSGNFLVGPGGVAGGPVVLAPNGMPLPPQMIQTQQVPNLERTALVPIRPVTPDQAENLNTIAMQFAVMSAPAQAPAQINPPEALLPPSAPVGMPADIAALVQAPVFDAPKAKRARGPNVAKADAIEGTGVTLIVIQDPALALAIVNAIKGAQ
jgi:PD-(D/E)XK nuclease superfamily